jgi:hypothetical protein
MVDLVQTIVIVVIIIAVVIFFYLLPRYGPHYTSKLSCPRCKKQFNYHWVPGASWASLRRGKKRNLRCPYCHQVSTFELASAEMIKTKLGNKTEF